MTEQSSRAQVDRTWAISATAVVIAGLVGPWESFPWIGRAWEART